jgi:hypothetical protein
MSLLPAPTTYNTVVLATSDDMAVLINKVQAAAEMIKRYENELLVAADVLHHNPQIRRDLVEFEEVAPDEAMAMLRSLLPWIQRLAQSWPAPNLKTLMNSKGLLFLLAYVRMCEKRSIASMNSSRRKKRLQLPDRSRLAVRHAHTVAYITLLYTGKKFKADNLVDKLQDFHEKHPTLYGRMIGLLENLEEVARSRPRR